MLQPPQHLMERRFDGATPGRRGSGMGVFHSINTEVGASRARVMARARYLAINNPYVLNAVENWVGSLIGPGIMPTSQFPEAGGRKALVTNYLLWSKRADFDRRTDFAGMCADIARALVVDGEAFLRIYTTADGVRLQQIPAELVDESMTRDLGGGAMIVQGVEFDAMGQRVAYWIFPARPTDQFQSYSAPIRVPAENILHVMKPLAAGQVRGISWLAPVVLPANDFDQLLDALLVGVKVAAMHAGFLTDINGTAGEPYTGTENGGIMESGLEPGTLKRLPSGVDVKFSSPQQARDIGPFLRQNLQALAAGIGVPQFLLDGDLTGANYSSLRAGLIPFRTRCEQIQYGTLVPQLLDPVWMRVALVGVVSGAVAISDMEGAGLVEWIMPHPMQVDPEKDTNALILQMNNKLTSRRRAVAELGWDVEQLDEEIAADNARAESLGLSNSVTPTKKDQAGDNQQTQDG